MTRANGFLLAALFTLGTSTGLANAASAQQWGPPAQSKYYHDPSNQTLTSYNTSTATARSATTTTNTRPVAAAHTTVRPAVRPKAVAVAHRSTSRTSQAQ